MNSNNSTKSKNTIQLSSGHTNSTLNSFNINNNINTMIASDYISTANIRYNPIFSNKLAIEEDNEKLELSTNGINNSLYDYELFSMLETMKNILIEKNILTESEFDSLYNINKLKLQEEFKDKVLANRVLKELTDTPK